MARNLAVLHKKYAVDLQRAVGITLWFCRRPVLGIGKEEATAARTWRWRRRKTYSCARRRRRWRFSGQQFCISRGGRAHHHFLLFCVLSFPCCATCLSARPGSWTWGEPVEGFGGVERRVLLGRRTFWVS